MSYFFPPSKELLAPAHLRAEEDHAPATEVTEVTQVVQIVSAVINGFLPQDRSLRRC